MSWQKDLRINYRQMKPFIIHALCRKKKRMFKQNKEKANENVPIGKT